MRVSLVLPAALAAVPMAMSAAGTLGFAIGARMPSKQVQSER